MNRCLIKLHESSSDVVYKVHNPFAQEKRDFFFFSDPPHLVKTVRNCWQSRKRSLWVRMCIICIRLWCINVLFASFSTTGRPFHGLILQSSTIGTLSLEWELSCAHDMFVFAFLIELGLASSCFLTPFDFCSVFLCVLLYFSIQQLAYENPRIFTHSLMTI